MEVAEGLDLVTWWLLQQHDGLSMAQREREREYYNRTITYTVTWLQQTLPLNYEKTYSSYYINNL